MNKALIWIVVIVVLLGGIWWWMSSASGSPAPANTAASSETASSTDTSGMQMSSSSAPMSATVTYDGASFSPSSVTIMQGGTVNFVDTNGTMWIASDPHPTHEGYDGTTRSQHCASGYTGPAPLDECASGAAFSFTFDKVGSWGYHDHMNHGARATVVVVAQ